jgi:hypothetical protein
MNNRNRNICRAICIAGILLFTISGYLVHDFIFLSFVVFFIGVVCTYGALEILVDGNI